jgi:hypothetical protein
MTGFNVKTTERPEAAPTIPQWTVEVPERSVIEAHVARAQALRSEALGQYLRHLALSLRSILRRPGSQIPRDFPRQPKATPSV